MSRPLRLWLTWLLATAAAGAVIGAFSAPTDFFWYIFMTGLVIGVAQWLVLRRYLPYTGWWILASALGWFLGVVVIVSFIDPIGRSLQVGRLRPEFWMIVVDQTVTVAVLGVAQWLVLRRHTQRAGWWVFASAISGAVYGAVGADCEAQTPFRGMTWQWTTAFCFGAAWAGYAAVTGLALVWLLPNHTSNGA